MNQPRRRVFTALALPAGLVLLVVALLQADIRTLGTTIGRLGAALPLVLVPGAVWHAARTVAWWISFPIGERPAFWRLFRVRLAAEAFSFVTIRGVAGEPLKVLLLEGSADPRTSTAAVALERIAYIVITCLVVLATSILALAALPLSRVWVIVFVAVAGVAGAASGGLVLLLMRPQSRRLPNTNQPQPTSTRGRVVSFVRAVDSQLRTLVQSDMSRLAVLSALQLIAYAAMALEVWVTLWAAGVTPSFVGAFAIETFTRVTSMASAFIPGNLGALEASNVVAAGMIQASAGAAALAVVRRLRGLLWCGLGFACYPRSAVRAATTQPASATTERSGTLTVVEDAHAVVPIDASLGGLPIGERIVRAAVRAGFARVIVRARSQRAGWETIARRMRRAVDITVTDAATMLQPSATAEPAVTIASSDVPSPAWLRSARGGPPEGDVITVRTGTELRIAERRLRDSIVKPTDGRVGRFNRRFSIPISVWLIRLIRLPANAMSAALIAIGLYAGWLFSIGSYGMGVAAACLSLAASILDGCDGELARLQYKESTFGVWLDTLGDYAYYLAIFAGLTVGVVKQTGSSAFWWAGGALLGGTLLTFALLILLRKRITGGRPEHLRRRADTHFKQRGTKWTTMMAQLSTVATRATMPYGIVAFALANALPALLLLAALGANVFWISLSLELGRLLSPAPANIDDNNAAALRW